MYFREDLTVCLNLSVETLTYFQPNIFSLVHKYTCESISSFRWLSCYVVRLVVCSLSIVVLHIWVQFPFKVEIMNVPTFNMLYAKD